MVTPGLDPLSAGPGAYALLTSGIALLAAFFIVFFVIGIVIYVYFALALMAIAKKTKTPNPWLAWIPIANIYLMTQIGKVPGWVTAGIVLAVIPYLGGLVITALACFLWWKIAEARGKPGWWGLLIGLVPIVNLVFVGILAWKDK